MMKKFKLSTYHFSNESVSRVNNSPIPFLHNNNPTPIQEDNKANKILINIIMMAREGGYKFYRINLRDYNKIPFVVFCKTDDIEEISNRLISFIKSKSKFYDCGFDKDTYPYIKEHVFKDPFIDDLDIIKPIYCPCSYGSLTENEDIKSKEHLIKNVRINRTFWLDANNNWFGFFDYPGRIDIIRRAMLDIIDNV